MDQLRKNGLIRLNSIQMKTCSQEKFLKNRPSSELRARRQNAALGGLGIVAAM
jgi:hypothetical protein